VFRVVNLILPGVNYERGIDLFMTESAEVHRMFELLKRVFLDWMS
jgi:hypothetical protein